MRALKYLPLAQTRSLEPPTALAPENPLVAQITTDAARSDVEAYVETSKNKSDLARTDLDKEKTGVFTGAYAINPVNGEKLPIWVADYVLMSYGTGAIMVPAHDERDHAFAKKFELPIIEVVSGAETSVQEEAYVGDGPLVNSGFLDGKNVEDAKAAILEWLEDEKKGFVKLSTDFVIGSSRAKDTGESPSHFYTPRTAKSFHFQRMNSQWSFHRLTSTSLARMGSHRLLVQKTGLPSPCPMGEKQREKPIRCLSGQDRAGTTCVTLTQPIPMRHGTKL